MLSSRREIQNIIPFPLLYPLPSTPHAKYSSLPSAFYPSPSILAPGPVTFPIPLLPAPSSLPLFQSLEPSATVRSPT
ncbi:hypothetical protein M5K25_004003 [Dendrobium thyrsiflorum]|uniref:Uncharacterized protein n=1 Tax=Dendrobium thyrsiflorum TaxID=117978 RepID=A0ABD0VLD7_DENTH